MRPSLTVQSLMRVRRCMSLENVSAQSSPVISRVVVKGPLLMYSSVVARQNIFVHQNFLHNISIRTPACRAVRRSHCVTGSLSSLTLRSVISCRTVMLSTLTVKVTISVLDTDHYNHFSPQTVCLARRSVTWTFHLGTISSSTLRLLVLVNSRLSTSVTPASPPRAFLTIHFPLRRPTL